MHVDVLTFGRAPFSICIAWRRDDDPPHTGGQYATTSSVDHFRRTNVRSPSTGYSFDLPNRPGTRYRSRTSTDNYCAARV
ncbi:hypothetical protein [Streptomyces sp. NPDC050388]|uniref:hypothetical protein n=1 Tax=Streptomyces sp. NPDC050388 TaxID=3155781 RepID=UPI0034234806